MGPTDRRETIPAKNFHWNAAGEFCEIEFCWLGKAREIHYHQDRLVFGTAQKCKYLWIFWKQKFERTARERPVIFAHRDDASHPPEQRREILLLILDIDRFVVVFGINRDREIKLLRIGFGKAGIPIGAPLHRGAATVAIAEIKIVAHADFVAIVQDRRSGQRKQENIQELDLAAVVDQQGR